MGEIYLNWWLCDYPRQQRWHRFLRSLDLQSWNSWWQSHDYSETIFWVWCIAQQAAESFPRLNHQVATSATAQERNLQVQTQIPGETSTRSCILLELCYAFTSVCKFNHSQGVHFSEFSCMMITHCNKKLFALLCIMTPIFQRFVASTVCVFLSCFFLRQVTFIVSSHAAHMLYIFVTVLWRIFLWILL